MHQKKIEARRRAENQYEDILAKGEIPLCPIGAHPASWKAHWTREIEKYNIESPPPQPAEVPEVIIQTRHTNRPPQRLPR
jgi:hypothetical protein